MKICIRKFILVICLYIGVLWSWLQYSVSELFGYWDELFALLGIIIVAVHYHKWIRNSFARHYVLFFIGYIVVGLIGNVLYGLIDVKAVVCDVFINVKFPVCLLATYCLFSTVDIRKYSNKVKLHIELLSILLISAFAANIFLDVFPVYEVRFGIKSVQLFFAHPTFCAGAACYLLLLRVVFIKNNHFSAIINGLLALIIVMTLRYKAIVSMFALAVLAFFVFHKKYQQLKLPLYVIAGAIAFAISYDQVSFYFSGYGLQNFPRGALLVNSVNLMKMHFPFGAGFGSFGSYYSGVYYSPVYKMLGIHEIYGLSRDNYNAITDQYWPMVTGQTGIIGLILMILVWIFEFKWIEKLRNVDLRYYLSAMGGYMYILISSTSESAVCNPVNIPFALFIGILLSQESVYKRKSLMFEKF